MNSEPIIVYLVVALAVTRIPFLRTYISLCYTLIHEVFRVCIGGQGKNMIKFHSNNSKMEEMLPISFKQTIINYVGYSVTSVVAIGLFYLVSTNDYQLILYIFIGLIAVSLLFWIRSFSEFIWALSIAVLLTIPIYFGYGIAIMHTAIFLASYTLIKSVLNALRVLKADLFHRQAKGIVAKVKWIPSMILGLALLGQSLYAGYFVVSNFTLHLGIPWEGYEFVQLPWA